jgi:hypothetical protein
MVRLLLLVRLGVLLVCLMVQIVLGVVAQLLLVVGQLLVVVMLPSVLVVVLQFVCLLHRKFDLGLLLPPTFLLGSLNRNGLDIVLPLT